MGSGFIMPVGNNYSICLICFFCVYFFLFCFAFGGEDVVAVVFNVNSVLELLL